MPMSRKPRDLSTDVSKPGGTQRAQRKQQQHATKRKKRKDSPGSWGGFGLICTLAGVWIAGLAAALQSRRKQRSTSRAALEDMLSKPMIFSEHAKCRMDCRHITTSEVDQVLRSGTVNSKKSDNKLRPCPKYVVDGRVGAPLKNVQAVFSSCLGFTNVVTVIDKDKDWTCFCP